MNQIQRSIAGTTVIALIVAALFYIPWRVEVTGDLTWAPFYRNPIMGRSSRITGAIETRLVELKGRPVWALYAVQLALIGSVGAGIYWHAREEKE
jgi:hypothetical protein